MKKSERLNGLIFALNERGRLTAKDLAELFEVSERTIYRDIDALCQLKVPIVAYEGLNGGYEINSDYFLPSIKLNKQEILMLLIALRVGEELKLPTLSGDYQLLRAKIINTFSKDDLDQVENLLDKMSFYFSRIEPTEYVVGVFSTIIEGLINNVQISMEYYVPKRNQLTKRILSPTELFFDEGGWYLTGFCHMRNEKRTFRLDRIRGISLLEEKNQVKCDHLNNISNHYIEETYILELLPSFYRVIKDNFYMSKSQILSENSLIRVQVVSQFKDEITKIILSNPNKVTIIEPASYKKEIQQLIEALSNKYL
ncbi:YafY family transcriptional regulator [Alkaliphilus pronyensis]|uniref:YafY family transcriptional regulator n=1 Tax=Alkaliphilus pronyensis TaxID=1482732 RepID=A0A6I0FHB0_9FIRM|nr:YafY family protein [Alkaliphilus pronyensis]KAB3538537.1 YafY family transcriptional regulator [Alkaliphilus pronyensis]